jgi:hypothetical protein
MLHDRTSLYEFTNLVKELETAGVLFSDKQYSFDFATVDKPYDSYTGLNVRLRYFLKVTVTRQYAPNLLAEQELVVQSTTEPPASHSSIKMEVRLFLLFLPPSLPPSLLPFSLRLAGNNADKALRRCVRLPRQPF